MIYSIIFAFFLLNVVYEVQTANIKEDREMYKHRKECILKSKANENDIKKLKTGIFPPSTPELKAYAMCMLSVRGILLNDTIFMRDPIIDSYSGEKKQEQIKRLEKCLIKKGGELKNGDAYEFVRCYYNKNKIYKALL